MSFRNLPVFSEPFVEYPLDLSFFCLDRPDRVSATYQGANPPWEQDIATDNAILQFFATNDFTA